MGNILPHNTAEDKFLLHTGGLSRAELSLDVWFSKPKIDPVLLFNQPDADVDLFQFSVVKLGSLANYSPYCLSII